jgi:hypothetical protein
LCPAELSGARALAPDVLVVGLRGEGLERRRV